jgi:hypothetical protein
VKTLHSKIGERGVMPNIPRRINRKWKNCFSPFLYRNRNTLNFLATIRDEAAFSNSIINQYREFVTNETLVTELRKRFEAIIGPVKNAGGVR